MRSPAFQSIYGHLQERRFWPLRGDFFFAFRAADLRVLVVERLTVFRGFSVIDLGCAGGFFC